MAGATECARQLQPMPALQRSLGSSGSAEALPRAAAAAGPAAGATECARQLQPMTAQQRSLGSAEALLAPANESFQQRQVPRAGNGTQAAIAAGCGCE